MKVWLTFALGIVALPGSAASFHVDPVNGSDSGDGSAAHPVKSLPWVLAHGLVHRPS